MRPSVPPPRPCACPPKSGDARSSGSIWNSEGKKGKRPGKCRFSLSAPLGGERVGVRWGTLEYRVITSRSRRQYPPHPKSFSPLKGGEGLPASLTAPPFVPLTS